MVSTAPGAVLTLVPVQVLVLLLSRALAACFGMSLPALRPKCSCATRVNDCKIRHTIFLKFGMDHATGGKKWAQKIKWAQNSVFQK